MGGGPKDLSCESQVDSDLLRLMQTAWGWESGTCHPQIEGSDLQFKTSLSHFKA